MFGFLLPLPLIGGLGARVAITVLIVYALLPIVRTTIAGIRSVDPALVEAGTALGMTPRQLLRQVQLPLALPSIVAGIRVAAVIGVGTATIAAAVGAGGTRGVHLPRPVDGRSDRHPRRRDTVRGAGAVARRRADARGTRGARPAQRRSAAQDVGSSSGGRVRARRCGRRCRRQPAIRDADSRRVEELHRADPARRAAGADARIARRSRRASTESRRHVHLRSRHSRRRHRRATSSTRARRSPPSSGSRPRPIRDAFSTRSAAATRTPA